MSDHRIPDAHQIADLVAPVLQALATAADRHQAVRAAPPEGRELDPQIRRAVLTRDRWSCQWCHTHARDGLPLEIDHIVPWSAGGTNATDNLRALCQWCNEERSNYATDTALARALLIVGSCCWCREWDTDITDVSLIDREVPVWCLRCRRNSATSRQHADDVRSRQARRYAPRPEVGQ